MSRIQSSIGLITGVPIEETVNQLMKLNALPRTRLAARNDTLGREQAAVTSLTTLVIGVQLTTDRLGQSALFSGSTVSSSKPDLLAARSTGTPAVGSYSFVPVRQAQSQQLTSSLYASADQKLSAGTVTIHAGGFLDQSANLDQLNGGAGVSRGFIRITDRSGKSQDIDLRYAQNASDVVSSINASSLSVVAKIDDGRFVLTDVSGSTTSNLVIENVGAGTTARDLGFDNVSVAANSAQGANVHQLHRSTALRNLRDGLGVELPKTGNALQFNLRDGSQVNFSSQLNGRQANLGQLIDEVNAAGSGKLRAGISSNGQSVEIEDLTTGLATYSISSPSGSLADQIGLDASPVAGVITSDRLQSGLGDTLLSTLGGGSGVQTSGSVTVTDKLGQSDTINLSSAKTLQDVINLLNDGANNASFRVQLNRSKTGIEVVDTSGGGGSLQVQNAGGDEVATALKIAGTSTSGTIDSGSLNRQFIGRNTTIRDFMSGGSLARTSIRFTDSAGRASTLNLATRTSETIGDIVDGINDLGLGIEAGINQNGDGIMLIDTAGGQGTMTVADVGGGAAASQLKLAGTATSLTLGDTTLSVIDGSKTIRITTTANTSISDLATQINQLSQGPLRANLINLGSSGVRLQLNGVSTGAQARNAITSTSGIDFSQTAEARDALVSFGASESGGGVLVNSNTNKFTDVVSGLELTVNGTSSSPVQVDVTGNTENITKQIDTFVEQFNKLRDKLTVFDSQTNQVGLLFGSNVAIRTELAYSRLFTSSIRSGPPGTIQSLPELGIKLNDRGKLTFDKQQFESALAENPEAVKDFFSNQTNGFSQRAKAVSDSLASVESGALLQRTNALQQNIEQNASRISAMDLRLERQRNRLLSQFYSMEQAISRLQRNMTSVNQLQSLASVRA
jgi:flagellar hook-associated protein 2